MLESIIDIVRRAGELVRSANDVTAATHEKNGPADLVTEYDLAVQRFLRQELLALLPEADFFGEEGQHDALTSPWTFIVDPIDGTTNFVRGFAYTNISVALAKDGQVEYAAVYAPLAGELYAARRGGGATLNGRAIHVSGRDPGHSLVVCGSTIYDRSYTERHFAIMRYLYDRGLDYRRFGAAALDLCQVRRAGRRCSSSVGSARGISPPGACWCRRPGAASPRWRGRPSIPCAPAPCSPPTPCAAG